MKNKLPDVNNHIFALLERLGDEEMSKEDLANVLKVAPHILKAGEVLVKSGHLALNLIKHNNDLGKRGREIPDILSIDEESEVKTISNT